MCWSAPISFTQHNSVHSPRVARLGSKSTATGTVELPCLNLEVAQATLMHCS
jgi:hypothetical protein